MKNKIAEYLVIGLGIVGFIVLISLLLSIPVWLLWNWLMPVIFGLKEITIWQAWGILMFSNFLFKTSQVTSSK